MPPEGCFLLTSGRPIDPELLARIQAPGQESLCELVLSNGLKEQSRYKLLRAFFPVSFREFRALERRAVASVGEACIVYVALGDEGTTVWRAVNAERVAPGLFRLEGPIPNGEKWEFEPGEVVRCVRRTFSDGKIALASLRRAEP